MGEAALAEARLWLGTPYRHQASLRGVGADCLGLIRGIWREVVGPEPETPGAYTPDWSEANGRERLLQAAQRRLIPISQEEARPGDVLLFRMRSRGPAKHLGVLESPLSGRARMIHAYSGRGVVSSALGDAWRRRIVAQFRFPEA